MKNYPWSGYVPTETKDAVATGMPLAVEPLIRRIADAGHVVAVWRHAFVDEEENRQIQWRVAILPALQVVGPVSTHADLDDALAMALAKVEP